MVLNYLFTGLIAALMAVPGTGQKEAATVGEEPVVKEQALQTAYWRYNNSTNTGAKNASNYTPVPDGDADACGDPGTIPCIMEIEGTPGNAADLQDFLDEIDTEAEVADEALHTKL